MNDRTHSNDVSCKFSRGDNDDGLEEEEDKHVCCCAIVVTFELLDGMCRQMVSS
jgi:hypothetical protein